MVSAQCQEFTAYRKERGKMLLSRRNQLLLEFTFWNEPVPREGPNIYELRSYQLRVSNAVSRIGDFVLYPVLVLHFN